MRIEFLSRLALLVVAAFLVVATQVWSGGTLEWLFIAGGVVMLLLAAADLRTRDVLQRGLDGVLGVLGIWSIVQAIAFDGGTLEWVSFATAVAAGLVAIAGLAAHEASTERVVHELQVTPAADRTSAFAS
jgi:peptidoglycan/LPS O-acetylase OafA/YrhL